ncbi:MAG: HAD family hydrolase [Xenococcaceae cyanobacterium MO_207.B15]|nr:HAD family hydrolase [Xenococcaceae cyanobacterium MO_207.B15]
MLRLITDFDGPIMDVSPRYYYVYQYCLEQIQHPNQKINQLSKAEFWELKRSRVPERKIGLLSGLDETQADDFARLRKNTVHNLPYLAYDTVIHSAIAVLEELQNLGFDLVVMTMRKQKELDAAFDKYDLARFFPPERRYCLPNDHVKTADVKDKPLLMARALKELPTATDVWMVGDTEADIVAAKTHNIKVIGVLSGIRDRNQLERYEPDFITDNLQQAVVKITSLIPYIRS